jgi:hypothetical protein
LRDGVGERSSIADAGHRPLRDRKFDAQFGGQRRAGRERPWRTRLPEVTVDRGRQRGDESSGGRETVRERSREGGVLTYGNVRGGGVVGAQVRGDVPRVGVRLRLARSGPREEPIARDERRFAAVASG